MNGELMIGCISQAKTETITVDEHELEAAAWFSIEDVAAGLQASELGFYSRSHTFRLPPAFAIAHQLVRFWLTNVAGSPSLQSQL